MVALNQSFAPEKPVAGPKNRVGDFFPLAAPVAGEKAARTQQPRRENADDYGTTASGMFFYGFRYYDPKTGRWLSRDPIAERGGLNLYGFVGNEPVGRWDVLGLHIVADSSVPSGARYSSGSVVNGEKVGGRITSRNAFRAQVSKIAGPNSTPMTPHMLKAGLIVDSIYGMVASWAGSHIVNTFQRMVHKLEIKADCIKDSRSASGYVQFALEVGEIRSPSDLGAQIGAGANPLSMPLDFDVKGASMLFVTMDCNEGSFSFYSVPFADVRIHGNSGEGNNAVKIDIRERWYFYEHSSEIKRYSGHGAADVICICCKPKSR